MDQLFKEISNAENDFQLWMRVGHIEMIQHFENKLGSLYNNLMILINVKEKYLQELKELDCYFNSERNYR